MIYDWFLITSIVCTYPAWMLLMLFGSAVPPGAEGMRYVVQLATCNGVVGAIVGIPTLLMLYIIWPVMATIMYGGQIVGLVDIEGVGLINFAVTAVLGGWFGFYLAAKLLPRIDAYFGVQNGFSQVITVYNVAGAAYLGVKAAKLGAKIVRRI